MALAGIPIPETQCIGDSLDTINSAFQTLDTAVAAAAGAGVTKITAGTNISISPTGGTGDVTINAEGGATVTVLETPPGGAQPGDLWFDSSSGVTSVYYDGTWVDVGGGDSGTSAGSVNGIVKSDGAGNFSAAVAGTDYLTTANFTGANQSFTQNGYQRLPGGLIIQWFNANTVNAIGVINFPIAWPNGMFAAVVSEGSAGGWVNGFTVYGEEGSSNTQLQIVGYTVQNGGNIQTAGNINFNAIAIGY